MASESQHRLLRPTESNQFSDPALLSPQQSWDPLGSSRQTEDTAYHPVHDDSGVLEPEPRETGLGISHVETMPRVRKRTSQESSDAATSPGLLTPSPWGLPSPSASAKDSAFRPVKCPSRAPILHRRLSWVSVTILFLALYATVFSGVYLVIGLLKPRWESRIGDGGLAPSTANLLSALFAKTIELSYVTVCVAFLGQVLSRRALTQGSRGISLSDMSMRTWIMQPGSLIIHWENVKYSGLSFLGMITLTATLVAMLYTTAAEALVSPKLLMGPVKLTTLQGSVAASFANTLYLDSHCDTPVTVAMDPVNRNITCLEMEHVGHAYHNYQQWITEWSGLVNQGNGTSTEQAARPRPTGSIYDNTTVTGSWIDIADMTALSSQHGRLVNNVTMAMPHGGILSAAKDPINRIRQPHEASGQGKYSLEASVPSPAVNVLCVGMTKDELSPLIYTEWPNTSYPFSPTNWSVTPPPDIPRYPSWLNQTVVDDLFGFGEKYGQRPPVFGKYPKPYNSITNTTGLWPTDAIYLLGASPDFITDPPYVLCSLKAKQTGVCSTRYEAASSGASFYSHCEDAANDLQYSRTNKEVTEGMWEPDWKNVASGWANALSLGSGIADGQASNDRLLMQFVPGFDNTSHTFALNRTLPSISEALAVMAGSTLILSSQHSPLVHFWNYTEHILSPPTRQSFSASVQAVGYASGGAEKWQGVFYVILVFAFVTSAICFVFLMLEVRGKQVTDFTEPPNLFALAMNSPCSARLQGACGGGPEGRQLKEKWFVGMEEEDEHYYMKAKAEESQPDVYHRRERESMAIEDIQLKPVSPAVDDFRRVSQGNSFFSKLY